MPVCASVRPKLPEMLLNKPIGMNSEVLNTNAEQVSPASASHWRAVMAVRSPMFTTFRLWTRTRVRCKRLGIIAKRRRAGGRSARRAAGAPNGNSSSADTVWDSGFPE